MSKLYSKATGGFYPLDMHDVYEAAGTWPTDGVEITAAEHTALLAAQAAGKLIQADTHGRPVAVDRPAPTTAELSAAERRQRNDLLSASDWTQLADVPDATKKAWQTYRQALRDIPKQSGFPTATAWPVSP